MARKESPLCLTRQYVPSPSVQICLQSTRACHAIKDPHPTRSGNFCNLGLNASLEQCLLRRVLPLASRKAPALYPAAGRQPKEYFQQNRVQC